MNHPLNGWRPTAKPSAHETALRPPLPHPRHGQPLNTIERLSDLPPMAYYDIKVPRDIERHVNLRRKMLAEGHDPSTIPDSANLSAEDLLAEASDEYRVLYATFVDQYMIDFDPLLAAMRCGFNGQGKPSEAGIVAENLMGLPVIQRLIAEYSIGRRSGSATSLELVYAMLRRETMVNVSGSTQKGRIDAIVKLGELAGFIAKQAPTEGMSMGVIEVPQLTSGPGTSVDAEWESVAVQSQKVLKDSVRN